MQSTNEILSAINAKDRQKLQELADSGTRLHLPVGRSDMLPLVHAAKSGDLDFCRFLMDLGAYSECVDDQSPLFNAIQLGFNETLEILISLGICVNQKYSGFEDASGHLHLAIWKHNFDAVKILLEAGADINQANDWGNTPIHCACEIFDSSCNLNSILDYFLSRPHINPKPDLNAVSENDGTPLMYATFYENIDAVNRLIKEGVNLDYIFDESDTALQTAAKSKSEEILLSLLRAGCSVNLRIASFGGIKSPLRSAASVNNITFCNILMEHGANVSTDEHLLHVAAAYGNLDMIDLFLNDGSALNTQDNHGATPLMCGARGNASACRHFIQLGARMDIVDKNGETALEYGLKRKFKNSSIYLIIEGSPRSKSSYKRADSRSHIIIRVLLLRFLFLTEISPLKSILDQMQQETRCIKEFRQMASHPHSLKHICRLNIREVLAQLAGGRGILSDVEKLPLPKLIKSYLGYEGELEGARLSLFSDEHIEQHYRRAL